MNQVLVTEPIHEDGINLLQEHFKVISGIGRYWEELLPLAPEIDAIIVRVARVPLEFIKRAKRLRVIAKHGTGLDNIDVGLATQYGISVVNEPTTNVEAVAELTVATFLALARLLRKADDVVRSMVWKKRNTLIGRELQGSTVSLVGMGRIGSRVADICLHGFGCRVLAYDPYVSREYLESLGIEKVDSVDDLLPECDFLSIHVPLTPETRGLIDASKLALLKPTAYVVNISRGGIVDEQALADALASGTIAGAAVDAFTSEPPKPDNPLLSCPNILLMPHMGAQTEESMRRTALGISQGVVDALQGRRPKHLVNPEALEIVKGAS